MTPDRRATLVLLVLCVLWGSSFFSMDLGLRGLEGVTGKAAAPSAFLLIRFIVAAALLPLFFPKSVRELTPRVVLWGMLLSVPFYAGFLLQVTGLPLTTPTVSAFITSTAVLATPVVGRLFFGERLTGSSLLGAAIAFAGIYVLTDPTGGGLGRGELLTAAAVVAFAFQIQMTNVITRRCSPDAVTLVMFLFAIAASAMTVAVMGVPLRTMVQGLSERHVAWTAVYNAVFCSVIAMTLMNRFQRDVAPTRAAVVYTLEPVMAAVFSAAFVGEPMTLRKILGGVIIVGGNLVCELFRSEGRAETR